MVWNMFNSVHSSGNAGISSPATTGSSVVLMMVSSAQVTVGYQICNKGVEQGAISGLP